MHTVYKMRFYRGLVVALLFAFGQLANVQAANAPTGIAEFAQCSRQCMQDNEQCQKELADKCKPSDADCLDSCDVAYPACMAECPKPGNR